MTSFPPSLPPPPPSKKKQIKNRRLKFKMKESNKQNILFYLLFAQTNILTFH